MAPDGAPERVCACGRGCSIEGKHPDAKYATSACRSRHWKERTGYDRSGVRNGRNGNTRPLDLRRAQRTADRLGELDAPIAA